MKKILVNVQESCHSIVKAYAGRFGKTMSEVILDFARSNIMKHASVCNITNSIVGFNTNVKRDKRSDKACWGYMCMACREKDRCLVGKYQGLWVPNELSLQNARLEQADRLLIWDHRINKLWNGITESYLEKCDPNCSYKHQSSDNLVNEIEQLRFENALLKEQINQLENK